MLSLGLDYLFLLLYPLWLALAVDSLGRRFGDGEGRAARAARGLAWLVLLAAPLDALENLALIRALQSGPSTVWAQTAWLCALPKFALVGAATSYLAGAGTVLLARRLRTT